MKIRNRTREPEDTRLKMTAMIDIVFLLLVFFVMTFTIVAAEGDFNVDMPRTEQGPAPPPPPLPVFVHLEAAEDGSLAGIQFNDRRLSDFDALHARILNMVHASGPAGSEESFAVELACDERLKYEHLVQAITAVSGYVDQHGNKVTLIENVRLR